MRRAEKIGIIIVVLTILAIVGTRIGPIMPVTINIAIGSSMFPTIENGDMLVGVSKYIASIKPGDIALYKENGEYIGHRVIAVTDEYVVFTGDNNLLPDGKVPVSDVYYKVILTIPPYIWVPLFSSTLSAYGVFLMWMNNKKEQENEADVYSVTILIYFIALLAFSIGLVIISLSTPISLFVKPNPLPTIESYSENGSSLVVSFTDKIDNNPECRATISEKNIDIPLVCNKIEDNKIIIDVSPIIKQCKSSCITQIEINYRVNNPYYNVTVSYPITTVVTG